MALAMKPERGLIRIETLLEEAIGALAALDAERVEEMAGFVESIKSIDPASQDGPVEWPRSAAEWRRAAASHWALGHLADATGRQLAVQRRIAGRAERSPEYRLEGIARRLDRWSGARAWPPGTDREDGR